MPNTKAKRYGPKLKQPRIKASKEHRSCGPLGYALRAGKRGIGFISRDDAIHGHKIQDWMIVRER